MRPFFPARTVWSVPTWESPLGIGRRTPRPQRDAGASCGPSAHGHRALLFGWTTHQFYSNGVLENIVTIVNLWNGDICSAILACRNLPDKNSQNAKLQNSSHKSIIKVVGTVCPPVNRCDREWSSGLCGGDRPSGGHRALWGGTHPWKRGGGGTRLYATYFPGGTKGVSSFLWEVRVNVWGCKREREIFRWLQPSRDYAKKTLTTEGADLENSDRKMGGPQCGSLSLREMGGGDCMTDCLGKRVNIFICELRITFLYELFWEITPKTLAMEMGIRKSQYGKMHAKNPPIQFQIYPKLSKITYS